MIHEIVNKIPVHTPHGFGYALFVIRLWVGCQHRLVVRLKGGVVKHYYSEEIRMYPNEMDNNGKDLEIP